MTKYQLGKLIALAGTLQTRKRVQKVVHLLQAGGLPFSTEFRLHHFGPYSSEVAALLSELVRDGVFIESTCSNYAGREFHYRLSERAAASLGEFEKTSAGRTEAAEFVRHSSSLERLLAADLRQLELASTVAFFRQKGIPWAKAVEQACEFKHVAPDSEPAGQARELAEAVVV